MIAKRRGSPYEHRRSKHWLKMKCEASQELVVGGFTDPQGARVGLGALLVGYYEGDDLVFAGKIGTGFDTKLLLDLRRRLDAIEIPRHRSRSPRACRSCARTGSSRRSSCRSASSSGPCNNKLRHPRLIGVRFDKNARARSSREVVITHPEKVHVPGRRDHQGRPRGVLRSDGAGDAAAHARAAVTMERYPPGIGKKGFWQKDVSKGFPDWLERVEVPKKDGVVHHPVITDERSLMWVTNQNTITQHVWTSRVPDLYYPDICVFDLDPSKDDAAAVRAAALGLRDLLDELGLPSWVKTSGSKGFHIVVPLDGKSKMDDVGAIRNHGRARVRVAGARSPDAGVQQGRSQGPHLRRYRAQRLQRDVRGGLHRAREARRAGVGAVHVGRDRKGQGRARHLHAAQHAGADQEGRRPLGRHAAKRPSLTRPIAKLKRMASSVH